MKELVCKEINMHKIIIPDIHQNIDRLNSILQTPECQEAQEIIFLGDYFDSFDYDFYTPEMCKFLNNNINNERYTFLIGNHDIHYISSNTNYRCSGWSFQKQSIVDKFLDKQVIRKLRPFKYEMIQDKHFLFSHAGLHPSFVPFNFSDMLKDNNVSDWFNNLEQSTMAKLISGINDPLFGAGKDRGGFQKIGGITWLDWRNFELIENLNQVVGHSYRIMPDMINSFDESSININIDTNLRNYLRLNLYDTVHYEFLS